MNTRLLKRVMADAIHELNCGTPPSCEYTDGTTRKCNGMLDRRALDAATRAVKRHFAQDSPRDASE